jgi:hypothetical protein
MPRVSRLESLASMSDNRGRQVRAKMIRIVAHRGYWRTTDEKNNAIAFERALEAGYGIETDVRDAVGTLVISHDMPRGGEMELGDFLRRCARFPDARPLALNVKADGMQRAMAAQLSACGVHGHFVFDMSVPDALAYIREGVPAFTRLSEFEPIPAFLARATGVWLDAFESDWFETDAIRGLLDAGKQVCVVSPELHGRNHVELWRRLRESDTHRSPSMALCTDYPDKAREFFYG